MVRQKLTYIKENCLNLGFELLDEKYRNNSFKHTFRCINHNQIHRTSYKILKLGLGLRCCRLERIHNLGDFRNHTIDQVKAFSKDKGYEFLDETYDGINHKHFFKCLNHNKVSKASYKHIKRGCGLKCCKAQSFKPDKNEYVFDKLDSLGFKLVGDYKSLKSKCLVKCKKHGQISFVNVDSLINKKHILPCCEAERPIHIEHEDKCIVWHSISPNDESKCLICRKKDVVVRPSYVSEEINVGLCYDCKSEFHKTYGYTRNTKEQLDEYILQFNKYQGDSKAVLKKIIWK